MESISALVARGEGEHVEFKSQLIPAEKLARSLAAFANSAGGTLLVGIDDNGTPLGLRADEETFYCLVQEATRLQLDPPIDYAVSIEDFCGKPIGRIDVPVSTLAPHRLTFAQPGRDVYLRTGASVRLAAPQTVRRLGEPRSPLPISPRRWTLVERTLQGQHFTATDYLRLVNTSRRTARSELIRLVAAGYLQLHTAGGREEYSFP